MHQRISIDPWVCHGKPVIAGTRVLVANILAELAAGADFDTVRANYPNTTSEDIRAALEFASALAMFETALPLAPAP